MKTDNTTRNILNLLRKNARMSYKEIAESIGKPESTIRDRIQRMEKIGLIQGYTVILDKKQLGFECSALVLADVDYEKLEDVTKKLLNTNNVLRIYHTSGNKRIAFVVVAKNFEDLEADLNRLSEPDLKNEDVVIILKIVREFGAPLEF
ncbi:MAG: Lrp/AsnC family transcriptional regulator [Thermoplasmata archaeon]|nr:Lrp/AsnC family transcriptional regulator [Thermoplasmata archaeon]